MPADDSGERTEEPTERRRSEARQKGNVARSVDLVAAGLMMAAATAISVFGLPFTKSMGDLMRSHLGGQPHLILTRDFAVQHAWEISKLLASSVLPILLLLMASAAAINLVQVGFLLSPEALEPKLARLNPIEGAKRIVSVRAIIKLAASLGKLLVVGTVAGWSIYSVLPAFLEMIDAAPTSIFLHIEDSIATLAMRLAMALIVLALLDFAFQKWKHGQDLKMSKQEIREELKQMDGDPLVRQRRREAHKKLTQAQEMRRVKEADVVITNPTHIAIAIKYDPETTGAPIVLAKGVDEVAMRIRRIAVEHRIPIIERKELARALYRDVKAGQQIPLEMYEVFVEIMAYVYRLTGKTLDTPA